MFSKRELEGYVEIDHRESPGITSAQAAKAGCEVAVGKGVRFQSPTYRCSHCEAMVVMRPDRSRIRGYCRKCDRYLCDNCSLVAKVTGECSPFNKFIDDYMDNAAKGPDRLAQMTFEQTLANAQRAAIVKGVSTNGSTDLI